MTTLQFMSIERWCKTQGNEPKVSKCEDCRGTGEIECPCCNHVRNCDKCDGSGEYLDYSEYETEYKAARERDTKMLLKWEAKHD